MENKVEDKGTRKALIFSIEDKVGGLKEALDLINAHKLNMSKIESRPSRDSNWDYDFFVDFENITDAEFNTVVQDLQKHGFGAESVVGLKKSPSVSINQPLSQIGWFPRKISDLDEFANKVMEYGSELSADHPGFTDPAYRDRRTKIVEIAKNYKHGQPIPRIDYTPEEIGTWRIVYNELKSLYPTHACRAFNYVLPLLEQNCGYGPDNIPQLEDVSRYLKGCTGWSLRPVQGLLSARDFLNGLAFRVFHSTQYIRHHSAPLYTPEPDVCHELLGHVPLFADPDFADFSQEIGLASLGASEEDLHKLLVCYWYTVEFGLCEEDGQKRAYGAGLLSSFGELKYCLGGNDKKPSYVAFDPFVTSRHESYPITEYQPFYYVATSFQRMKEQMLQFSKSSTRPFTLRYNALTQSVDILDTPDKIIHVIREVQNQLANLTVALADLKPSFRVNKLQ